MDYFSFRLILQMSRIYDLILFYFIETWKQNVFEEEGIVCATEVLGCKRDQELNDNKTATALRQEANPLKLQITNTHE